MIIYDDHHLKSTLEKAFENPNVYKYPKGIVRYDYGNSHGWWVRINRDAATFRTFFSDGQCGSIQEALKKAIEHRHEILALFPVTLNAIGYKSLPLEPEKRIQLKSEKGHAQPYVYWEAKWYNENHKVKKQNFSVLKFGADTAKVMAFEVAKSKHNRTPKITKYPDSHKEENLKEILRSDVEVLSTINANVKYIKKDKALEEAVENSDPFGFEGEKQYVLHTSIERDNSLREEKIRAFLKLHEELFCELCKFSFAKTYKFLKKDIIEVHHIVPLSTLSKSTKVTLNDLMLLCANCHTAIHQGDAQENLLIAMEEYGV
jgi:predicted HNH restriction endonuclease